MNTRAMRFGIAVATRLTAAVVATTIGGASWAQIGASPSIDTGEDREGSARAGDEPTLGGFIASIAEKSGRGPGDFERFATTTLQIGQAALQQGQRIPDSSIWDGIHAVDAGELAEPLHADWESIRAELEKLLEKPPEDQQQQQDQQQQDQQNEEQENQEERQEGSDSQDQNDTGEQNSGQENGEDASPPQEPESENEGEQPSSGEQNDAEDRQQNDSGKNDGAHEPRPQEKLGDMDENADQPKLENQNQEETREIGGGNVEPPPRSAKQAMTLQQLEQLRQQDKPGALHMLLQNAEQSDQPPARKMQKDW